MGQGPGLVEVRAHENDLRPTISRLAANSIRGVPILELRRKVGALWSNREESHLFARVTSLAISISDSIRPVMVQFVAPALIAVIPSDYHHWIFPMIDVACKAIGASIAWFLFRVLAAVHSGIIGWLACARAPSSIHFFSLPVSPFPPFLTMGHHFPAK